MKSIEYWLKRNRRRITFGRFLSRAATSLGAFLFLFGALVLGVRLVKPEWWPNVLWLALLEIPMLLAAFWYAMIVRPKPYEADAVLDERLGTGGLLMTLRETGNGKVDGEWAQAIAKTPKQWKESLAPLPWARCAKAITVPVLFAIATCMIPGRSTGKVPVLRNSVGRKATGELQTLLEQLRASKLVDPERAEELAKTIKQLVAESETQPLTHEKWGVIDSVRDAMKMEMNSSAVSTTRALNLLQSLQRTLGETGFDPDQLKSGNIPRELLSNFDAKQTAQLAQSLAEITRSLSQNSKNGELPDEVRQLLQQVTSGGELKLPEDLGSQLAMLNSLSGLLKDESSLFTEVGKQMSASDSSWASLGGSLLSSMWNGSDTSSSRRQKPPTMSTIQSLFGNESNRQKQNFDQVKVDAPNRERNLEDLKLPPNVSARDFDVVRNKARNFEDSEGKEQWSRRFRPRHRTVVERYFANDK